MPSVLATLLSYYRLRPFSCCKSGRLILSQISNISDFRRGQWTGDHCVRDESRGIRKRISKRRKAQHARLLSIRRPLGAFSCWFREVCFSRSRKHSRSPGSFPTRRMNFRESFNRPGSRDQHQQISPTGFPDRDRFIGSLSCPEKHLRAPGTEGHDYVASSALIPSPRSCSVGQCGTQGNQGGSSIPTVGSIYSNKGIHLCGSPPLSKYRWPSVAGGGPNSATSQEDVDQKWRQQQVAAHNVTRQKLQTAANEISELKRQLEGFRGTVFTLEQRNTRLESNRLRLESHVDQQNDEKLSLIEEVQHLRSTVSALEKVSREHESCAKSSMSEVCVKHNAIGGYADESATPSLLNTALSNTKTAVARFQKAFVDAIKHDRDPASIENLLKPDAHFARKNHISFAAKAAVHEIFFEGFENESFNTLSGVSRFLDPGVRQNKSYEYYLREKENHSSDLRDPQFEAFCEMKILLLWEKFNLRLEKIDTMMKVTYLEALGGSELVSNFRMAATNVWLLHKLAFSFEPPASIFRVEQGAVVDLDYMEPVVSLEDSPRFVNKVGFMIAPGFRIQKAVVRCEIYLSGAAT